MAYRIVHRTGSTGRVVGRAKTRAGAERSLMRCNRRFSTGHCVVLTSTGYVHPAFAGYSKTHRRVRRLSRRSKRSH